ncbi:MAG: hypothetical protein J4G14_05550, partial [Dehalococcoidia bacterium]|nr:hypothetical protein [Dehalococcoidia bacterium]
LLKRMTRSIGADMRVWMGRLLLVLVGLVAAMISMISPDSIFALVSLAWGGMGATFGPVVILALYWRRFNVWGALTAVAAGASVPARRTCGSDRIIRLRRGGEPLAGSGRVEREPRLAGLRNRHAAGDRNYDAHRAAAR